MIATASDAEYFPALMGLLRSLVRTNHYLPRVVFDGGLTPAQVRKVSGLADVVRREPFTSITARGKFAYITDTTFLKFEAVTLDADKVLFLDADMVVLEDLEELFSFPRGTVGVVPEVNIVKNMFRLKHRETLTENIDIDWEKSGFNGGIFALRPAEWKDIKERALSLIDRFGAEVFSKSKDQQLLNIIFAGKTHYFPRRYNFSPFYDEGAIEKPAIIHYLAGLKPWHDGYPRCRRYREFRRSISILDHPAIIGSDITNMIERMRGINR